MRRGLRILCALVLASGGLIAAEEKDPPPPGREEVAKLVRKLGDGDFKVREEATRALSELVRKDEGLLDGIQEKDPDPEVQTRLDGIRREAGVIADPRQVEKEVLDDWLASIGVEEAGPEALAEVVLKYRACGIDPMEAARVHQASLLAHKDPTVRARAAERLGWLKENGAAGQIAALLEDEDARVRGSAARALSALAGEKWPTDREQRVAAARAWWAKHKGSPEPPK